MNQANTNTPKFFDLHVSGIGYCNRAREVPVKRGEPFLAVDISALHGSAEDVQHTRFDCRVSGSEAQAIVRELMPAIEAGKKVLVGFKLGDLYPETFTYKSGDKQGQTGVSLKARLLRITWAKVDGVDVYRAPQETEAEALTGEVLPASASVESVSASVVSENAAEDSPAAWPNEVRLSKDDPAFEQRKAELKQKGYRWNAGDQVWRLTQAA